MDDQYIEIEPSTGEVKVKARIDRDGSSGVTLLDDLTLTVTDLAGHSTSANLNVSVLDVNDNAPECTQTVFRVNITEGEQDGKTPGDLLIHVFFIILFAFGAS